MCAVYFASYPIPLPSHTFRWLLHPLPAPIQQKILQYRRWQDAHACLLGKHLLMTALKEHGYPDDLHRLQYNAYGRPCLPGSADFNISHSGRLVACVICPQARVGIDIEEIRPMDISDFKNQFSEKEWAYITRDQQPPARFFSYWTCKEAIIKADGRGLQIPLPQLDVADRDMVPLDGEQWHIQPLNGFPDYACHIACNQAGAQFTLREIKF